MGNKIVQPAIDINQILDLLSTNQPTLQPNSNPSTNQPVVDLSGSGLIVKEENDEEWLL